jgi:hypothetical protein
MSDNLRRFHRIIRRRVTGDAPITVLHPDDPITGAGLLARVRPLERADRRDCALCLVSRVTPTLWWNGGEDVLSSWILVGPGDLDRSLRFYRDVLGLAVYPEFGFQDHPGMDLFLGQGLLELS